MKTILSVIIAIAAIIVIITVAITESEQSGLGTLSGEQSSAWGEHRGTSKKDMENRVIMVSAIIFVVALIGHAAL